MAGNYLIMDTYEKIGKLKQLTDIIGLGYGTEDLAIYLYSIVKMIKPATILELGTGLGSTSLWMALALEENKKGQLHTFDDGSSWSEIDISTLIGDYYKNDYKDYIESLINQFKLEDYIKFYNKDMSSATTFSGIDILFNDYLHEPYIIARLFADYLLKMNENSYIFIDGVSTSYPSFMITETIIKQLNNSTIPKSLLELVKQEDIQVFRQRVESTQFELTHIIEHKDRSQNSTVQIRLKPLDFLPQPRFNIRF